MDASQSDGKLTKSTTSWLRLSSSTHRKHTINAWRCPKITCIAFKEFHFIQEEALLKNSHGKPLQRLSPHFGSSEMYRKSQPSSAMAVSDEVKIMQNDVSWSIIRAYRPLKTGVISSLVHVHLSWFAIFEQTKLANMSVINIQREYVKDDTLPVNTPCLALGPSSTALFTRHLWQVQSDRSGQMRRTSGRTRTCLVRIQKEQQTI